MKIHEFKKYQLGSDEDDLVIDSGAEVFRIPKNKIKEVFSISYRNSSNVKWFHQVFVGLIYFAICISIFMFTFEWSEQQDQLENPSQIIRTIGLVLFVLSGVLFLSLIALLFEATSDFPGFIGFLTRTLFARKRRFVVIQRKTVEYHLRVKKKDVNALEERIKLLQK